MSTLAGARLEEMADIRATRKKKIVFICSSIAATCLVYGAIVQAFEQHWGCVCSMLYLRLPALQFAT